MKEILYAQLKHILNALNENINSIKSLIDSSDALGKLIEILRKSSKNEKHEPVISGLQENKDKIKKSIDDLMTQYT